MMDRYLKELEDRVIDLEHRDIKRRAAIALRSWRKPTAPARTPAKRAESATVYSTRIPSGGWRHETRDAMGRATTLPQDPNLWPEELRELAEAEKKFAEYDRSRTQNGRIIGYCTAPVTRVV